MCNDVAGGSGPDQLPIALVQNEIREALRTHPMLVARPVSCLIFFYVKQPNPNPNPHSYPNPNRDMTGHFSLPRVELRKIRKIRGFCNCPFGKVSGESGGRHDV